MWDKIVWFFDELAVFFSNLWNDFLGSFASVIEAVPAPDFLLTLTPYAIPDSILYYASAFNIQTGISIIVSAYIIRFLIRRIPVIG